MGAQSQEVDASRARASIASDGGVAVVDLVYPHRVSCSYE